MVRKLKDEELRLWSLVAATVKPAPGKAIPRLKSKVDPKAAPLHAPAAALKPLPPMRRQPTPDAIEPNRKRKIVREQQPLAAVIDLHGMNQDRAERALTGFIARAFEDGHRSALVITGRGVQGHGVLKQRAPEWLSKPELRHMVAGFSDAHQKHGGEGAVYVALKKRRP